VIAPLDDDPPDCPTCNGDGCEDCDHTGELSEARAYDLSIAAAEQREMSEDDEAHAWRERQWEREMDR